MTFHVDDSDIEVNDVNLMKAFTDLNIRCYHSILVPFGRNSDDRKI